MISVQNWDRVIWRFVTQNKEQSTIAKTFRNFVVCSFTIFLYNQFLRFFEVLGFRTEDVVLFSQSHIHRRGKII